jgi:hypothetical protein
MTSDYNPPWGEEMDGPTEVERLRAELVRCGTDRDVAEQEVERLRAGASVLRRDLDTELQDNERLRAALVRSETENAQLKDAERRAIMRLDAMTQRLTDEAAVTARLRRDFEAYLMRDPGEWVERTAPTPDDFGPHYDRAGAASAANRQTHACGEECR